jgi:exodeoxyribonuclease X
MADIRVVDLETNGLAPPAAVLEVGWCDLTLEDERIWILEGPEAQLFGCPDPLDPVAHAAHHIHRSEIEGRPPFDATAFLDATQATGALVVASHNWDFEEQWLAFGPAYPAKALCTSKAALRIWPEAPSRGLSALRYWLEDAGLINEVVLGDGAAWVPHRAGADAYVCAHLLQAMLMAGFTARQMVGWTREPRLLPRCTIGKFRGKPWAEVETGFLQWMTRQEDMEADLKWNASRALTERGL